MSASDEHKTTHGWHSDAQALAVAREANDLLREEILALRKVLDAARCIRHWHDREPDGMVVSAEHVRALWTAIAEHDEAMGVPADER